MNDSLVKATSLRELRRACVLRPLRGKELDVFWENTDAARDPEQSVRLQIRQVLEDAETQRILVYGHKGCGKSTELEKLRQELGGGWFTVRFSILDDAVPIGLKAEDVLLSVAARLLDAAKHASPPLKVKDEYLKPVKDFFARVSTRETDSRQSELSIEAGAHARTGGLLAGLVDLFAGIRGELKFGTSLERSVVAEIRKRPADLVRAVNGLVEAVRLALPEESRMLIIVEDLDKVDLAVAHDLFIRNAQLLASISGNIIYTIPLFTFYCPSANVLTAQFNQAFSLPMVKVTQPDGSRAPGFETVRRLVLRRLEKRLISDDALDLLIQKTAGVLRHVFEVLNTVSLMTSLREAPIRKEHVEYGLKRLRSELATQIALPPEKVEGVTSVKQLYDWLWQAAKSQRAGQPKPRSSEPVVQVLLQSCALVEYNGSGWLGVHPLAQEYLVELGYNLQVRG